jgi:dUTP pyrophosphatase
MKEEQTRMSENIYVMKNDDEAVLPKKSNDDDVGYDLYPLEDLHLLPGKTTLCRTGIVLAMHPPEMYIGHYFRVLPSFLKIEGRSGHANKGVFPVGGIIDPGYRGEIKVVLFNSTNEIYDIPKGKAMAQLVLYYTGTSHGPNKIEFAETSVVSPSDRGVSGFGSTDQK